MKHRPVRHVLEYIPYLAASRLLMALPHDLVRATGRRLGALAHGLDRKHRSLADANIQATMPEMGEEERRQTVKRCYRNFGSAFCEPFSASKFSEADLASRFRFEGWSHVEEVLHPGKALMFICGHFGSWQVATYPLSHRLGGLHVVARPPDNPYVARDASRMRERFGVKVLPRKGVAHRLFNLLRKGARVGIVIDQRPPPMTGVVVPFLGRPARTSETPAVAAIHTRTSAVPMACRYDGDGRYVMRFGPAIEPEPKGPGAAERLMERYLEAVGRDILAEPEHWFWMHDRWKTGQTADEKMRALREARDAGAPMRFPGD
jgi:KDO2-lipid IV(A) lauroyltransferase